MTTTLTNLTDSELTDRAAALRKALAATEAEIEVREKTAARLAAEDIDRKREEVQG